MTPIEKVSEIDFINQEIEICKPVVYNNRTRQLEAIRVQSETPNIGKFNASYENKRKLSGGMRLSVLRKKLLGCNHKENNS